MVDESPQLLARRSPLRQIRQGQGCWIALLVPSLLAPVVNPDRGMSAGVSAIAPLLLVLGGLTGTRPLAAGQLSGRTTAAVLGLLIVALRVSALVLLLSLSGSGLDGGAVALFVGRIVVQIGLVAAATVPVFRPG